MRESVKNKRKIAFIAIAIIITMLMGIVIGVLPNNPMGNTNLGTVADDFNLYTGTDNFAIGGTVGLVNKRKVPTGNEIAINKSNAISKLRADMNDGSTEGKTYVLTEDIDFGWIDCISKYNGNNVTLKTGNPSIFRGTLDGNGYTIKLTDSIGDGSNPESGTIFVKGDDTLIRDGLGDSYKRNEYYGGLFTSVNYGTIKNVTFTFANNYFAKATNNICTFGFGGVCGKNGVGGVIDNVKMIYEEEAKLIAKHPWEGDNDWNTGNRVILGGICANQSGRLSNVHVEMKGKARLASDSQFRKNGGGNIVNKPTQPEGLHTSITGGVYGAYTSTGKDNTFNLSFKGSSEASFGAVHTVTEPSGSSKSQTPRSFVAAGCIAGFSIQGVKGVYADFKGKIDVDWNNSNNKVYNKNLGDSNGSTYEAYLAFTGTPVDYYHVGSDDSKTAVCANNNTEFTGYDRDLFSVNERYVYPAKSASNSSKDAAFPNIQHITRKNSDAEDTETVKSATKRNTYEYDRYLIDVLGGVNIGLDYATDRDDAGKLTADKRMSQESSLDYIKYNYTANDIIWSVEAKGEIDGVASSSSYKKIAGYDIEQFEFGREFKVTWYIDKQVGLKFTSGKRFTGIKLDPSWQYTGSSRKAIILSKITEGIQSEIVANINGTLSDFSSGMQFVNTATDQNVNEDYLTYPKEPINITLKHSNNTDYTYFSNDYRTCIERISIEGFKIEPTEVKNTNIEFDGGWSKEEGKVITIKLPSLNDGAITGIKYCKDGENIEDANIVALENFTAANGATFKITEESTTTGTEYKFILYKGNNPVAFTESEDGSKEAFKLTNADGDLIKIDASEPTFNQATHDWVEKYFKGDSVNKLWYGKEIAKIFEYSDIVGDNGSGLDSFELLRDGEPIESNDNAACPSSFEYTFGSNASDNGKHTYKFIIKDVAGNDNSIEFEARFDVKNYSAIDRFNSIEYKSDGKEYRPGTKTLKTVNVKINATNIFGTYPETVGGIYFAPTPGDGGDTDYSKKDGNTTGNAKFFVEGVKDGQFNAEIKSTYYDETWSEPSGVPYSFTVTTVVVDPDNENKPFTIVIDGAKIWIARQPIILHNDDIAFRAGRAGGESIKVTQNSDGDNFISFKKTYDRTSDLIKGKTGNDLKEYISLQFTQKRLQDLQEVLDSYDGGIQAENLFENIDIISAKFYEKAQGNNAMINANEDLDDYVLIVEIRVKDGVDFALKTNYYSFTTKQDLDEENKTLTNSVNVEGYSDLIKINRIGIDKKELTGVSIKTAITNYGKYKIGDDLSIFDFKLICESGLLEGDSIDDLDVAYHIKGFDRYIPGYYPDAGTYKVSATQKGWTNYKLAPDESGQPAIIGGDLVIRKHEITKVTFANNEFSNISAFEVPNVKAYFTDAFGNQQELKVIYKNSDFEQVEFKAGKKMPVGIYYYVVIIENDLDPSIKLNNTCTHMPSELIKRFEVVGDKIVFNEDFKFKNWDSKDQVIRLTFSNEAFNIYDLIEYLDSGLHGKIVITYGYDENDESNILEIGDEYFIRLYVAADDKYAVYEGRFNVVVERATVDATANDISLPSDEELVYDNTAKFLTVDNISDKLQGELEGLITDAEKELKGESYKDNFNFNFIYVRKIGDAPYDFKNGGYDETKIIDCGTYGVQVTITGKNINDIVLVREYTITKRDVVVEFDFAKLPDGVEYKPAPANRSDVSWIVTKTFDTQAVNLEVKQSFLDEINRLTAGHDNWGHGFGTSNGRIVAGTHKTTYDFNNSIVLKNPCINLINNVVEVQISQAEVKLDLTGLNPDTEYKGTEEIRIKEADLKALEALGVNLENIEIDYSRYLHLNAIEPVYNVNEYNIGFNVSKANNVPYLIKVELKNERNVIISNTTIEVAIRKAKVNSDIIGLEAWYVENGKRVSTDVDGTEFSIDYSGYGVTFDISDDGKENLNNLKVYEGDWTYILRKVGSNENLEEAINAGKYEFRFTVTNENYLSEDLVINITINKKKLDEYTGVFDSNTWYIKQAGKEQYDLSGDYESYGLPNESDLESGLIYRREYEGENAIQDLKAADKEKFINANRLGRDYTQRFYSMRLRDHDMLVAEGFEITYYYDGIEAIGVSQAGSHTITAKITKNDPNWEDKIVELYKLDNNGNFVYNEDYYEVKNDADGRPVITRSKAKMTLNIAKAELQEEIDYLANELQLAAVEGTFANKFYSSKYTKEQIRIFENKMYRPLISGSNAVSGIVYETTKYKEAGEYSIIITIFMKDASNLSKNDLNYESAEMETTITINPMEVTIYYKFDEKNLDSKGNLKYKEGAEIDIRAYYYDYFGDIVYIENLTIETINGEGEDMDFGTPGRDKETGEILYTPNRYQVTPVIADTNYFYNEEAINEETNAPVNALRFTITNVTSTVNTSLYVIAIVAVAMLVIAGFVVLYMVRMFNPAVQDISLGNDEGIEENSDKD